MTNTDNKKKGGFSVSPTWIITSVVIPLIAWCVSIEVRLNSSIPTRVTTIETEIQPVLIEYGVQQKLAERTAARSAAPDIDKIREEESDRIRGKFQQSGKK